MAITTYPLNGIDYDAAAAAGYTATRTSGVYSSEEDFAVTAAGGLSVTVSAGVGWVHPARFEGYSVIMRKAETLTLALADGQRTRIDRIVLRYDAAARKSSLLVLQGTPDTQPTAPGISRTALLYDLCLAQIARPAGSTAITAGNITDTRLDPALCGVMRDGVTGIPTEELIASARERINALEETASAAAKEAKASKTAAAQSEANAKAYKEAAATSERNAAGSASASAGFAAAAARSESAAAGSATAAAGSASAAAESKTAAATSEANAAKHEEAAKKAADEAGAKAGTDKTFSIENAPADAKATGDALAGKADSVDPHDLSIPITGWQTDTEVAEYPHYIDITADVTSTTVVSVSIDPASADVAGKAMLVNPETRTGAIRIRAHNIPTAEISARWYPIKYGGQFYGDGSIYSNFLLAAHPVGSIYQTISPENPSVTFGGGTWERIEGRFIMGASDTYPAGSMGGEAAHELTKKEMPRHEHFYRVDNKTGDPQVTFPAWSWGMSRDVILQNSAEVTTVGASVTPDGENQPHNNIPPYYSMYIWRRVA